ncbi:hypothetical protein D9M73_225210 [compost metagenome]
MEKIALPEAFFQAHSSFAFLIRQAIEPITSSAIGARYRLACLGVQSSPNVCRPPYRNLNRLSR